MVYLIIGLSGVGKSVCCKAAKERLPSVDHVELDNLIDDRLKDGSHWPQFFEASKAKIQDLERQDFSGTVLVDIGAGFFKATPDCFNFLQGRQNVIAIFDKLDNIFERIKRRPVGPWKNSDVDAYRRELTKDWKDLFAKVSQRLDIIGFSETQTKDAFVNFIERLLIK